MLLDVVKPAEDQPNDLVLRLYESMGGTEKVRLEIAPSFGIKAVQNLDMIELDIGTNIALDDNTTDVLEFRPFKVRTLLLSRDC